MKNPRETAPYEPRYDERPTVSALYLFRHGRRWTQGDLARRAGLTQETVSRLERGLERPRASTRARLAEALGQPEQLLFPKTKEG